MQLRKESQYRGQTEPPLRGDKMQQQHKASPVKDQLPLGTQCVGHARLWVEHFLSLTCPNNPARAALTLQRGKQKVGRGE